MSRGHNVARRLASQSRPHPPPPTPSICLPCLLQLRQSSTATSPSPSPVPSDTPIRTTPLPTTHASAPPQTQTQTRTHHLSTALLLSRAPLLTRQLTPFEQAYFLYQRRLNERLALPFSRYFYYPTATPQDLAWKRSIRERLTPARDIGKYAAYGKEGWNDEVLVGDKTGEREEIVSALVKDAEAFLRRDGDEEEEVLGGEAESVEGGQGASRRKGEEVPRPVGRVSEADKSGDERSLSRRMERTLYLLVRKEDAKGWGFPRDALGPKESLFTAAERIIIQSGGLNMNTWVIGNWPVNHQTFTYPQPQKDTEILGEKTFYMKARILAGQADLKGNKLGLVDYKWLAKEEIQRVLDPRDWNAVRNVLYER